MDNKKKIPFLLTPIMLLSAGHLFSDLYSGFIIPILPFIAKKLEISLPLAGLIVSLTGLTSSFLQPIYGYFSDRISKRFFIFWGTMIASIFVSLTGLANSYLLLALVVVIGNIGVGLFHPQATAYAGRLKADNTSVNMSIFISGGIIGYALGPMVSSSIVYFLGLKWTIVAAIPGILTALCLYFFLPKITFEKQKSSFKEIFSNLNLKKALLIPIILIVIIRAFMLMAMSTYFPFEWEDNMGYSVLTVGIIMTLLSFSGGILSVVAGGLVKKFGERNILLASFIIPVPLLFGCLFFMKTLTILSFGLYIIGSALLISTVSYNIYIAQRIVPQHLGIISGITGGFCWGIAGFLLFPLGIIIDKFDIFTVITGVLCLSFAAITLITILPKNIFLEKKA